MNYNDKHYKLTIKSAILGIGRMLGLPKYFLITIVRDRRLRRGNLFRNQRQFLRTADDVASTNPR